MLKRLVSRTLEIFKDHFLGLLSSTGTKVLLEQADAFKSRISLRFIDCSKLVRSNCPIACHEQYYSKEKVSIVKMWTTTEDRLYIRNGPFGISSCKSFLNVSDALPLTLMIAKAGYTAAYKYDILIATRNKQYWVAYRMYQNIHAFYI